MELDVAGVSWGRWALPYGVRELDGTPRAVVAVDDGVVDLAVVAPDLAGPSLDRLLAAGRAVWDEVRAALLSRDLSPDVRPAGPALLPFTVADYVDFYSSAHHAANVGRILRPGSDPLPKAWRHLPIGYHGRAGTVVVSGTDVVRPHGQRRDGEDVMFGPSTRLDLEVEVGFVVGTPSPLGSRVPLEAFEDHVLGVVLLNDWSARDVQAFETVPLGPFLGKSFATSVSPWVVPLAALEHARVPPPPREVPLAPYLDDSDAEPWGLDLALELSVAGSVVSRPRFRDVHWTPAQQLAHLTVNGASLRTGDLYASGTVSGPDPGSLGCLLELTANGRRPVTVAGGERSWLEDGDEVVITGTAPGPEGSTVPLGEVRGRVVPATPLP